MADSTGGTSHNFAVDSGNIANLVESITNASNDLNEKLDEIYNSIYGLRSYWEGESYDEFKNKCDGYKPSVYSLVYVLNAYAKILSDQIQTSVGELQGSIDAAFDDFGS